jgi:putative ABC transport system substrate-binding protein
MRRREFITLLGGAAAAWPLAGSAQEAGKIRRIGFLRVGEPPSAFIDGFRRGLREVGLVEGRDVIIEFALPQSTAQVPAAAAELVRRGVDILLASGTPSVVPAADKPEPRNAGLCTLTHNITPDTPTDNEFTRPRGSLPSAGRSGDHPSHNRLGFLGRS